MVNKESGVDLPHNIVPASQQQVALVLVYRRDGVEGAMGERVLYTDTLEHAGQPKRKRPEEYKQ